MRTIEADLVGTVKDGTLELDGSGERIVLAGALPGSGAHVRVVGRVTRTNGTTKLEVKSPK